jgi:SAM-dependent methyltransferase
MKLGKNYIIHSELALPFLETPEDSIKLIFKTLEDKFGLKRDSKQKLIDLGCGDGRIVIYAGLNYGILSKGCEINSDLVKEALEKKKLFKKEKEYKKKYLRKIKVKEGDLFSLNLKKYDFIYIYSLPTMQKFLHHVLKTAKTGAVLISYKYPLKKFENFLRLEYKMKFKMDDQEKNTYFYRML